MNLKTLDKQEIQGTLRQIFAVAQSEQDYLETMMFANSFNATHGKGTALFSAQDGNSLIAVEDSKAEDFANAFDAEFN